MSRRLESVYVCLQEILNTTLGRHVEILGYQYEKDEIKILERFELNKNVNDRSLQVALNFSDSSSLTFNRVVAAVIDWGYIIKRTKPLVWIYEDKHDFYSKIVFDVKSS